mmetsp:Transcript_64581/g.75767  ORF Transcript_64581/g.75767 Transcript_64581/m.75767 type:complete len:88 (+) Transcript_64581:231-494(+)
MNHQLKPPTKQKNAYGPRTNVRGCENSIRDVKPKQNGNHTHTPFNRPKTNISILAKHKYRFDTTHSVTACRMFRMFSSFGSKPSAQN